MGSLMRSIKGEKGASLLEFAFIMPLLLLLLLGIVEFGYLLGGFNDVRHGTREAARAAAVNAGDNAFLRTAACDAMDLATGVSIQFTDGASGNVGDTASVTVASNVQSLSGLGFIEIFLPSTLTSSVEFRLEQPSSAWSTDVAPVSC